MKFITSLSVEVKNAWIYIFNSQYIFKAWRLIKLLGPFIFISSSKNLSTVKCSSFTQTKFLHMSLSLQFSSVCLWLVTLLLTPSIHLSLGLYFLRVPSDSHSRIFHGNLFPVILFTRPNQRNSTFFNYF